MNIRQRDSFALQEIRAGNIPSLLKQLEPVSVRITDSLRGKTIRATFFVTPDYVSIGTDDNWARIPLTASAAQLVADKLNCFLPTRRMVEAIYRVASVKLEPVPLFAHRDSTPVMWHHHLIIEGQRKGRRGLIAGIKKDVVLSGRLRQAGKRVAIFGWHRNDGKPIQPLYTGHGDWYVDYSHGIRLVYTQLKVDGKWMHYTEVLKDPALRGLLCDEDVCDFYRYPTD